MRIKNVYLQSLQSLQSLLVKNDSYLLLYVHVKQLK